MKRKILLTTAALTIAGSFALGQVAHADTFKVVKGDTLYSLSKKYNMTLDEFLKYNKLTSTSVIYVGQTLSYPGTTTNPSKPSDSTNSSIKMQVSTKGDTLNVRKGPSVQYGIIGKLPDKTIVTTTSKKDGWYYIEYNNLKGYVSGDYLKAVSTPTNPTTPPTKPTTPTNPPSNNTKTYKVAKGDTLYKIGKDFGVPYQDIVKWNNLGSTEIKVGQVLIVSDPKNAITPPGNTDNTGAEKPNPTTPPSSIEPKKYTVQKGDYLTKIAIENGTTVESIKALNGLTSDTIYVGQVLTLSKSVFLNPAQGILTSTYGPRWGEFHYGIDIAKNGVVPIIAAYDGHVIRSGFNKGWGYYVVIEHAIQGKKYFTLYGHLREEGIALGSKVKQGQQIGLMGASGNATGQHLHLELYEGSYNYGVTNIDPLKYFAY